MVNCIDSENADDINKVLGKSEGWIHSSTCTFDHDVAEDTKTDSLAYIGTLLQFTGMCRSSYQFSKCLPKFYNFRARRGEEVEGMVVVAALSYNQYVWIRL